MPPRQTGRLTVGHNFTLTLTFREEVTGAFREEFEFGGSESESQQCHFLLEGE
jgi:hypothetical protein